MYALLYIIIVFLTLLFMYSKKNQINTIHILFISIAFASLNFFMVPRQNVYIDSLRFFETLSQIRLINGAEGIKNSFIYLLNNTEYAAIPISGLYIFFISLFRNNGWLNFFTTILIVFPSLKMIVDVSKRNNASVEGMLAGAIYFFTWLNMFSAVSGVRQNIACSLYALLAYIYTRGDKNRIPSTIMLFVNILLLTFFHNSMIIYGVILLCAVLTKSKILYYVFNFALLFSRYFIDIVINLFSMINIPIFNNIVYKSNQYLGENAYIKADSIFSAFRYSIKFLFCILILYLFLTYGKKILKEPYIRIVYSTIVFAIGSFSDDMLFQRTVVTLFYLMIPILVGLFSEKTIKVRGNMRTMFVYLSIIALIFFSFFNLFDNARSALRFVEIAINNI